MDQIENKFTPGPWLQCGHERTGGPCSCGYIFTPDGRAYLAKALCLGDDVDPVCNDAERAANARLIASAPDLFSALEVLVKHDEAQDQREGLENCIELQNARAAIARATGGEP